MTRVRVFRLLSRRGIYAIIEKALLHLARPSTSIEHASPCAEVVQSLQCASIASRVDDTIHHSTENETRRQLLTRNGDLIDAASLIEWLIEPSHTFS